MYRQLKPNSSLGGDSCFLQYPANGWASRFESGPVIRNLLSLNRVLPISLAFMLFCGMCALGQSKKRSDPSAATNGQPLPAQQAFAASCAGCHGLDGKGGERAPDIVTRPDVRQLSDSQLFQVLEKGVPRTSMPSFSYLGEPALRSLVAYLQALQGNSAMTDLPGDARRGKEIFFGKAECSQCHMVRGEGGFFASDLTSYSHGRSLAVVHDAIVSPNRDLDPRNRSVVVTLPSGKTLEGIARNEDNFSLQLLTKDGAIYLLSKSTLKALSHRNESPMPADYGTRLTASEIDDLVNYLFSLGNKNSRKSENRDDPDD
jgi:cytochrome c oxidase cbb3-type subunit III